MRRVVSGNEVCVMVWFQGVFLLNTRLQWPRAAPACAVGCEIDGGVRTHSAWGGWAATAWNRRLIVSGE